jgi:hypothetical protein
MPTTEDAEEAEAVGLDHSDPVDTEDIVAGITEDRETTKSPTIRVTRAEMESDT